MHDLPRVTFLTVADAFLVAVLVMVLGGCGTTSTRYRHGDFIMNIGAAPPAVQPAPDGTTNVVVAGAPSRG